MIPLQAITDAGSISAEWVLVGSFIVIGTLLVFIARMVGNHFISLLTTLTNKIEGHDSRLISLEKKEILQDNQIQNIIDEKEGIMNKIYAKWGIEK